MRRVLCTVLAVAALVFFAGPAGAQEAAVAGADLSLVASSVPLLDDGEPCTAVPDAIPGLFDFTGACANHDACYSSGEKTKAECDSAFLQDMTAACVAQHPSALDPARYVCLTFAQLYYLGVLLFGQFFF
jgi:hypothetical protein